MSQTTNMGCRSKYLSNKQRLRNFQKDLFLPKRLQISQEIL